MKNFTDLIKSEIIHHEKTNYQFEILLKTFVKINSKLKDDKLIIKCLFEGLTNKIFGLLKLHFNIKNIYIKDNNVIVEGKRSIEKVLEDIDFEQEDSKYFIMAHFLAKGSCTDPSVKNNHLEIRFKEYNEAIDFVDIAANNSIIFKNMEKNGWTYVYIKHPYVIEDFLKLINAQEAFNKFSDAKNIRNFEIAQDRIENFSSINSKKNKIFNERIKVAKANLIKNGMYKKLDKKYLNLLEIKKLYPDLSLESIAEFYNSKFNSKYSKSAINHWFREIIRLGNQ